MQPFRRIDLEADNKSIFLKGSLTMMASFKAAGLNTLNLFYIDKDRQ
jgi:hypothetical protein